MASNVVLTDPVHPTLVSTINCGGSSAAGAMTTAFAVPTDCPFPIPVGSVGLPASCAPANWEVENYCAGNRYYSPAVCPSGYKVWSLGTVDGLPQPAVQTGEYAGICCPVSWAIPQGSTVCKPLSAIVTATNVPTIATPIQVRWQDSDVANMQAPPATLIAPRNGNAGHPTSSASHGGSGSGLSSGAKAGLGVGIGLGLPLLAALIFVVFMVMRRRNSRQNINEGPGYQYSNDNNYSQATQIGLTEREQKVGTPNTVPSHIGGPNMSGMTLDQTMPEQKQFQFHQG